MFLLKLCFERYVRYLVRMLDRTRPESGVGAASARRGPGARGRRADGGGGARTPKAEREEAHRVVVASADPNLGDHITSHGDGAAVEGLHVDSAALGGRLLLGGGSLARGGGSRALRPRRRRRLARAPTRLLLLGDPLARRRVAPVVVVAETRGRGGLSRRAPPRKRFVRARLCVRTRRGERGAGDDGAVSGRCPVTMGYWTLVAG